MSRFFVPTFCPEVLYRFLVPQLIRCAVYPLRS
jgi:hypothetical protein